LAPFVRGDKIRAMCQFVEIKNWRFVGKNCDLY
jgi:hypothetical protein